MFTTFYEGFKIGKDIAKKRGKNNSTNSFLFVSFNQYLTNDLFEGDERCLGYRVDRQSEYQWITYDEVRINIFVWFFFQINLSFII